MTVLILAEHDNAALKPATLHALSAAQKLGGDIHLLVAGQDCAGAIAAAQAVPGIAQVLVAEAADYAGQLAEPVAALLAEVARTGGYSHVVAAATGFGKNTAPRAAALLDSQQVSDIVAVEAPNRFQRPIYAGNAIATVECDDAVKVVTVRTTGFPAAAATGGSAPVQAVSATLPAARARFVRHELTVSARPELTAAKVIVSGGRGLGSAENFAMLERVADRLGGAVGASRAAVDAGFVPNDYQVGQTGKVVAPELYLAVGISGAIQHLAGMKDSKVIVAINKDPDAPIFQVADYGLVGDLFAVLPELEAELDKRGRHLPAAS